MKVKTIFGLLLVTGMAGGALWVGQNHQGLLQRLREMEARHTEKTGEIADLQRELAETRAQGMTIPATTGALPSAAIAGKPDARELLAKLAALKTTLATDQPHALRKMLGLFEQLAETGPAALPAIEEFLTTKEDAALEANRGRGQRDIKAMTVALVPYTLRLGLFEVVRRIGGDAAEQLLFTSLGRSVQGLEIACLTEFLEQMAPGQYRDGILKRTQTLLAGATGSDRDHLFGILQRFGDDSYVSSARTQLVQADGKVDRSTLRYLQQTLGEKSVALAAQTYQDTRVTEADSRESLARVALAYVGANEQAAQLFHAAVLDNSLKPDQRRELVEDLNQDGLSNRKDLTPADVEIAAKRHALTQAYLQQDYVQNDKVLNAAFREADKDLANLLQRAAAKTKTQP